MQNVQNAKAQCLSFKISTQNLVLSVSYCLQHTTKCHILLLRNSKLFTLFIRIESTDGNFGTHEKVAIPVPTVTCTLPIPILAYFCSHSHGKSSLDVSRHLGQSTTILLLCSASYISPYGPMRGKCDVIHKAEVRNDRPRP